MALLERREMSLFVPSEHLSEPRGVFTTLYTNGKLRGCVGYPGAILPLYRAVVETARAAASDDPRFSPLNKEEQQNLRISISVLSQLRPISPEQIEIGRHGVVISKNGLRGLLLPQVAIEHGWDCATFLDQVCLKAGLAPNAWRSDAAIEGFTAETFAEDDATLS